jgi:hypothetical protein
VIDEFSILNRVATSRGKKSAAVKLGRQCWTKFVNIFSFLFFVLELFICSAKPTSAFDSFEISSHKNRIAATAIYNGQCWSRGTNRK